MLTYKGYSSRIITIDEDQGLLHGRVVGIRDVVTFEGRTAEELVQAFRDSVDDYLDFCRSRSESPDKPHSGRFVVRTSPDLHQQAASAAKQVGQSLNAFVSEAIQERLAGRSARRRPRVPTRRVGGS